MHNLFRSHQYSDFFNSHSNLGLANTNTGELATCIEFSMTFMQIMEKNFDIPDFVHTKDKDYYFMMFSFTLQFIETNGQIEFRKSRFSITGSDTNNEKIEQYKQYPLNYSFKQFVKDTYLNVVNKLNNIKIEDTKKTYLVSPQDKVKILACVQHLDKIFPNEKDFIIIDKPDADFYKADDSQDGVLLYQNSCVAQHMQLLNEKFPEKKSSISMKHKKI